jgi:hypothetical protein
MTPHAPNELGLQAPLGVQEKKSADFSVEISTEISTAAHRLPVEKECGAASG